MGPETRRNREVRRTAGWVLGDLRTLERDTQEYGYHYLSGVLRITKKRTIAEISRTAGVPEQNMHHYISNSPWSGAKVINQVRTENGR